MGYGAVVGHRVRLGLQPRVGQRLKYHLHHYLIQREGESDRDREINRSIHIYINGVLMIDRYREMEPVLLIDVNK